MFQDLEPGSVYVKIIEYSIAGQCFLTSDIWEKILLKNRSSALKKMLKSFSTFKVDIYFVDYRTHVKMYWTTLIKFKLIKYNLGNTIPWIANKRNTQIDL